MRYSLKLKHRKCIKGYGFSWLVRKLGDKYGKKLRDTEQKPE